MPETDVVSRPQTEKPRAALLSSTSGVALIISGAVVAAGALSAGIIGHTSAGANARTWWPFVTLVISVALVITLISVVRIHAFLALILAALAAGLLALPGILPLVPGEEAARSHLLQGVVLTGYGLGKTAGDIGILIGLASIIGMCLLESGAADRIVREFLRIFGEKHAGFALLVGTYLVSIPIFFDTIFMLLVPLAKALRLRTGKDYVLYLMAICCAGAITHSMTVPHPGPTAMANILGVNVGLSIVVGLIVGVPAGAVGWIVCRWINRSMDVPLLDVPGAKLSDLQGIMDKPLDELPPFWLSIMPIILPVVLIWSASMIVMLGKRLPGGLLAGADFLGNPNIALLVGTGISIATLMRQRGLDFAKVADLIGPPLETAAVIIFITAAGGAFGWMLRSAGVGQAIKGAAEHYPVNLIVLSYVVGLVIRIAQGSATVAMMTTAYMVSELMTGQKLPYHPLYIFLAIGWGAMGISWMNDSGFWVVSRLGGMSEKETLRSWTVLLGCTSLAGFVVTLILSKILPFA